jgi:hypothetical protein
LQWLRLRETMSFTTEFLPLVNTHVLEDRLHESDGGLGVLDEFVFGLLNMQPGRRSADKAVSLSGSLT